MDTIYTLLGQAIQRTLPVVVIAGLFALSDLTSPARIGKTWNRIVVGLAIAGIGFFVFAAIVLKW